MNRQVRVEKIIGTVKCVATCGEIESQPIETWNSSASPISFLTHLVGAIVYAALRYLTAAIKLPKHKNS